MPFVSYAQHGEDVVLWRALGGRDRVTYVDVGAFDPTDDSVTRALYERGWRGVNIEAQADRIRAFEEARPEDVNLAIAVGAGDGSATLTLPALPGWATIREPEGGLGPGGETVRVSVPMRSLGTLLPELRIEHVDVLKVDVEGAEPDVVRGLLAGQVRPTICVIEGVSPGFGLEAGKEAVALLVEAGYTHCMFDGLNHYLTNDPSLVESLSVPANPLDGFVHHRLVEQNAEVARLRESLAAVGRTPDDAPVDGGRLAAIGTAVPPASRRAEPRVLESASPYVGVTSLYRSVLGREPDPAGFEAWTARVTDGLPLLDVARKFLASEEARGLSPTERGEADRLVERWEAYRNLVELGAFELTPATYPPGRVAAEIFVGALYEAAFAREASATELTRHLAELEGGTPRASLLRGFARRREARARIRARLAERGERRPRGSRAYAAELAAWVHELECRRLLGLAVAYGHGCATAVPEG